MNTSNVRPRYEPPRSRDLSAFGVSGQEPLGLCADGSDPANSCSPNGTGIGLPNVCSPTGSVVAFGCIGGSVPA